MSEQAKVPPPPAGGGVQFNGPTLVAILYLLFYVTFFSLFIGLVLAYVWKDQVSNDWERSHYSYLVRSFWLALGGYACCGLAIVLGLAGAAAAVAAEPPVRAVQVAMIALTVTGSFAILAVTVMFPVRCILSLINAQQCQPMPRPHTWTI